MECDKCGKSFEVLNVFSPYGHDNPAMKEESFKNTGYCDVCFNLKKEELQNVVYKSNGLKESA